METTTKKLILRERILTVKDLKDIMINILEISGKEIREEYSDGEDEYLMYKQKSFEGEDYWVLCIFKIGDVGGVSKFDERNQTQYLLNEISTINKNGFTFNNNNKIIPEKIIIITNGIITSNSKNEINQLENNILYWDINTICEKLNEKWPDYFLNKEPVIHEYLSNLKNHLEDVSKELQILYYNNTIKKIWDIFIDLQLEETKIEDEKINFKIDNSLNKNDSSIVVTNQSINFKKIFKKRLKIKDIFEQKKDAIILGDMGSGKSTILKKMVLDLINEYVSENEKKRDCKIPIFLLAKDIIYNFDLFKTIDINIKYLSGNKIYDLKKLLNDGEAIIFIDGLDEIKDENSDEYFDQLNEFKNTYQNTQLIISSRPSIDIDKAKIFSNYRRFEILPLDYAQIDELLEKWFPTSIKHKQKLLNVLKKTALSSAIPKTPLAITLLAIIFDDDDKIEEIPANITELYNKFTEVFLGKWDKEHGITSQDKYGIRSHLINHIALIIHFKISNEIGKEDLFDILNDYKKSKRYDDIDIEQLESDLLLRNPLFVKSGNNYKFIHKSFQEYFVSKGIEQTNEFTKNAEEFLIKNFLDDWWSTVILFYVGNKKDCPNFIERISSETIPNDSQETYTKMDNLGKILQAAISTDIISKTIGIKSALKSLNSFRNLIINEASDDQELNSFFKKMKLNDLHIIVFLKNIFSLSFKSKHLKASLEDLFIEYKVKNISDLAFLSIAYTLSELTKDPEYLLDFCNNDNVKLEWKYLAIKDVEKYKKEKFPFKDSHKKIINSVNRKIRKNLKYLIFEFKKLNKIPRLKENLKNSDL